MLWAILVGMVVPCSAQTEEELIEYIKAFHQCFYELSAPTLHDQEYVLSNGKTFSTYEQNDFKRSKFVSVDALLKDVKEWRDSPFLFRQKRLNGNRTIADKQDLTNWEVVNMDKIASSYFEDGESVFHIAAHGLVFPDGRAADQIKIGGPDLDAKETAELIMLSMKGPFYSVINAEKQDFVVVLHCCNSAVGDNNFSRQLSEELSKQFDNVSVVGAPDVVQCELRDGVYKEYIQDNQRWKVYKNGKETNQGELDYKATVRNIQSH